LSEPFTSHDAEHAARTNAPGPRSLPTRPADRRGGEGGGTS
jgi:hypothetical protein